MLDAAEAIEASAWHRALAFFLYMCHIRRTGFGNVVVESVYESTLRPTQATMLGAGESRPVHGIAAGYLRGRTLDPHP